MSLLGSKTASVCQIYYLAVSGGDHKRTRSRERSHLGVTSGLQTLSHGTLDWYQTGGHGRVWEASAFWHGFIQFWGVWLAVGGGGGGVERALPTLVLPGVREKRATCPLTRLTATI